MKEFQQSEILSAQPKSYIGHFGNFCLLKVNLIYVNNIITVEFDKSDSNTNQILRKTKQRKMSKRDWVSLK